MKTLLLSLSILFSITSFSQPYLPMLEEGNVWSVDFYTMDGSTFLDQVEIIGETEINGKIYKDVHFSLFGNICHLREENGIVYHLVSPDDPEEIFYDFNLELGDIFQYSIFVCNSGMPGNGGVEYEVTSIETQFIAGENRKVIELKLDNFYVEYWIEGIGSLSGVDPHQDYVDMGSTKLVCFTKNGITTFFNGATACDNTELGINSADSQKIILSPNPVVTTSILQLPISASIDRIRIMDIHGRVVRDESVNKDYYMIDNMGYRFGLYFYQVYSKDKLIKTEKFIVK